MDSSMPQKLLPCHLERPRGKRIATEGKSKDPDNPPLPCRFREFYPDPLCRPTAAASPPAPLPHRLCTNEIDTRRSAGCRGWVRLGESAVIAAALLVSWRKSGP